MEKEKVNNIDNIEIERLRNYLHKVIKDSYRSERRPENCIKLDNVRREIYDFTFRN
jgi:hypothetical protein